MLKKLKNQNENISIVEELTILITLNKKVFACINDTFETWSARITAWKQQNNKIMQLVKRYMVHEVRAL